jgi:AraC-like DNA-binding protein
LEFKNICFSFSPKVKNLVYTFIEESNAQQPGCELYLQNLSFQIAISMLREGNHNLSSKNLSMQVYSDNKSVKTAIEFLTEHYDKTISLKELSHEVNYSSYHFLRIFKSATGMSPSEYLLNVKIEKAKKLLKYTNHAITEICYLCGFSSTSYFTQAFKRKTGVSPSYYKKNT